MDLEKYWPVIQANPVPFLVFGAAICASVWFLASLYYSGQVAAAKAQAELAEKQRDDFKQKLSVSTPEEAKTKVDQLEGELTGLNRIISVTVGYNWSPLTEHQIEDLADRLSSLQKHRVQIMYVNQLGKDLAQSFHKAFVKAGWDGATFSDGGGAHHGIIAGAGAAKAGLLKQAIEATTPYKVELDKPTVAEWDVVYLFVGTNPNKS
ncbi:hypothetical protein [Bradyrhizobium sp. USDA 313]|uniref:hypothetical protein n=1 Tax=Bradyrhizobium sp. USDA 313 TaxID=3156307 RepID=UPI0035122D7C